MAHDHDHHHHVHSNDYAHTLEHARAAQDHAFKESPDSPIPENERAAFQGLDHYPPDPAFRFTPTLVEHENPDSVVMETSDGESREFVNVGEFRVSVDGTEVTVQAYLAGHGSLFVPFRDATSGRETYGAGRYLDLEFEGTGVPYVLDFNQAYNPTCAYNEAYSCPFPPPANWLKVPIEAGEKTYPKPT